MCGPSGDAYRKALFSKKGFFVHISSENGGALEPESENTFRDQSPSVLLRDMSAKALFKKKGLCDMHRFSVVFIEGKWQKSENFIIIFYRFYVLWSAD